jgi:GNAT superfamily N-acetyltransferase
VSTLSIRPRRAEDVPTLCDLLAEQQADSDYPMRWPLPFPVEQFVVRDYHLSAWVGEIDGVVAGHAAAGRIVDEGWTEIYAAATGATDFECLSTFFTGGPARGLGLGSRLHDTVVEWIRARGAVPVLDVAPAHARALAMYEGRGWREVARVRPAWLPAERPDVRLMVLD